MTTSSLSWSLAIDLPPPHRRLLREYRPAPVVRESGCSLRHLVAWFPTSGSVTITGNLSKGGGSFKIDHPLDPENTYLLHSFVESPDMMKVYNGNVLLDARGEARVELPEWFEAFNRDFRYQLTCIGGFAPVYIAEEIAGNRFKIAGGRAGLKVSWMVTGIRQDAFANANRIPVEEDEPEAERGTYIDPEAWGQPQKRGLTHRDMLPLQ